MIQRYHPIMQEAERRIDDMRSSSELTERGNTRPEDIMSDQLFVIISGFVFAAGLWWLYFIEYRTYRIDHTRQRLFKIRDDLFKKGVFVKSYLEHDPILRRSL